MDKQRLRGILLNLQDRLSNDDRQRFNFYLADEVPRTFTMDSTFGGALNVMQSLFEQDKIRENDVTLLITAFKQIKCFDAAKHLEQEMKRMRSNDVKQPETNLSAVLPSRIDQLIMDQEDDVTVKLHSRHEKNNGGHKDESDNGDKSTPLMSSSNEKIKFSLEEIDQRHYDCSSKTKKYSWILYITLMVLLIVVAFQFGTNQDQRNSSTYDKYPLTELPYGTFGCHNFCVSGNGGPYSSGKKKVLKKQPYNLALEDV
ncbi:hypothetical protein I4U23_012029 [Adineta vaga]|nr:hypothetical protein I4U23_012029 [Adineta vaga]